MITGSRQALHIWNVVYEMTDKVHWISGRLDRIVKLDNEQAL